MPDSRTTVLFVWFTIAQAVFHLAFELYAHVLVGQSLPSLVADLLAVGLLVFGALGLLKWNWGPGILCGGWGFEFCQYYRSWVWRYDQYLQGETAPFLMESIEFLSLLLAISAVAFVVSAYICIRQEGSRAWSHQVLMSWIVSILIGALAGVVLRLAYKLLMQLPPGDGGPMFVFVGAAVPGVYLALHAMRSSRESNVPG